MESGALIAVGLILIYRLSPRRVVGTDLFHAALPAPGLRLALGTVLLAASLGLLTKAGLAIPPGLIVVIPLAVALAAWLYSRRGRRPPQLAPESSPQ